MHLALRRSVAAVRLAFALASASVLTISAPSAFADEAQPPATSPAGAGAGAVTATVHPSAHGSFGSPFPVGLPGRVIIVVPQRGILLPGGGVARGPSPQAKQAHDAMLERLGIQDVQPRAEVVQSLKAHIGSPEVAPHRAISETITKLRTQPFVNRTAVLSPEERNVVAHVSIDHGYEVLSEQGARLSPASYQTRIAGVLQPLGEKMKSELGVDFGKFATGKIAVVEGGRADSFNAATLPNGSIVVHRSLVDTADKVGAAVAASKTSAELVKNLTLVALDKFEPPAGLDPKQVAKYSGSFLAMVVGHEMTHAVRFHGAIGQPYGARPGSEVRARETVSDAGGIELASRSGYSALGEASVPLYFAVVEAVHGRAGLPPGDNPKVDHPPGVERYAFLYRYLAKHGEAGRSIYDGTNEKHAGAPLLSGEDRAELAKLPPPDAVRQYATTIAGKVQEAVKQQELRERFGVGGGPVILVPRRW